MTDDATDDEDALIDTDWIAGFVHVTRMAIWKWSKNPALDFPAPVIIDTGGRRKLKRWRKSTIKKWLLDRAVQRVEKTANDKMTENTKSEFVTDPERNVRTAKARSGRR